MNDCDCPECRAVRERREERQAMSAIAQHLEARRVVLELLRTLKIQVRDGDAR